MISVIENARMLKLAKLKLKLAHAPWGALVPPSFHGILFRYSLTQGLAVPSETVTLAPLPQRSRFRYPSIAKRRDLAGVLCDLLIMQISCDLWHQIVQKLPDLPSVDQEEQDL